MPPLRLLSALDEEMDFKDFVDQVVGPIVGWSMLLIVVGWLCWFSVRVASTLDADRIERRANLLRSLVIASHIFVSFLALGAGQAVALAVPLTVLVFGPVTIYAIWACRRTTARRDAVSYAGMKGGLLALLIFGLFLFEGLRQTDPSDEKRQLGIIVLWALGSPVIARIGHYLGRMSMRSRQ